MITAVDSIFNKFSEEEAKQLIQDFKDYFSPSHKNLNDSQYIKDYNNNKLISLNVDLVYINNYILKDKDPFTSLKIHLSYNVPLVKIHEILTLVQKNRM